MINKKPIRFWLAVLAISTLAACNDNDDDSVAVVKPPVVPVVPAKSFTEQIVSDVKTSSDVDEPKDVETVALDTTDDAEPIEVN